VPLIRVGTESATALEAGRRCGNAAKIILSTTLALLVLFGMVAAWTHRRKVGMATKDLCHQLFDMRPVEAGLLLFLATTIANVFCLPSFGLWIGAGVVFAHIFDGRVLEGSLAGTTAVFSGVCVGGLMSFGIGRLLFRECLEKRLRHLEWVEVLDDIVKEEGWKFVLLARMSPFLPLEALNYACALTSLSTAGFVLGCLGSLPVTAFWVWTAASAEALRMSSQGSDDQTVMPNKVVVSKQDMFMICGLSLVVLCILFVLLRSSARRYHEMLERRIPAVAQRRVARSQEGLQQMCESQTPSECPSRSLQSELRRLRQNSHPHLWRGVLSPGNSPETQEDETVGANEHLDH